MLYNLKWLALLTVLTGCDDGFQIKNGKPAIFNISTGTGRRVLYIEGADAATFEAIKHDSKAKALYAKDAKRVYIGAMGHAMPISAADPESFKILTPSGSYASDNERVYWYGVELVGADPTTFVVLKPPYSMDAQRVYVGRTPLEVNSLKEFEVVKVWSYNIPIDIGKNKVLVIEDSSEDYFSCWSRDGQSYYWGTVELAGADYASMKILNKLHAKDNKTVYFRGKPIQGADAESFVTVGPGSVLGQDKNYEYKIGKRVGPRK